MLITLANIGLIVLGFGILIFFHELGHFLAAKWAGIRAEAFAVGMGPVVVAYRKGVGVRFGSTERPVMERVDAQLRSKGIDLASAAGDDSRRAQIYRAMADLGLGETEYSLRWLPIGGFVRMLGQEDANPGAVSNLPGSYMNTPVGKRMVVIAAGVTMNLILAVVLFIWAFLVGVPFEAPIIGAVDPDMPAASAVASNAAGFGVDEPGLQPGDRVLTVDGDPITTFNDLALEAAMAKPEVPIDIVVERSIAGELKQLKFSIIPRKSDGLLAIGVFPTRSARLFEKDRTGDVAKKLRETGLAAAGVEPGMRLIVADATPVDTYQAFDRVVRDSAGGPVASEWRRIEDGAPVGVSVFADIDLLPLFDELVWESEGKLAADEGLLGFSPLTRVGVVLEGGSAEGVVLPGDVLLRVGAVEAPRVSQVAAIVGGYKGKTIPLRVLREGKPVDVEVKVSRKGTIGVALESAVDVPTTAAPIENFALPRSKSDEPIRTVPSPVHGKEIYAGSRLVAVNGRDVTDWRSFRESLRKETLVAAASGSGVSVTIEFDLPTPGNPRRSAGIDLSPQDVANLHALSWRAEVSSSYFEPVQVIVHADGNPVRALVMGFDRTWMFVLHTYVTIDRLFRGSVGVDQLRGPVGIVHLGTAIADKGFMYLVFFLALISVNLAVINFLPLPIMDGGLFLFLLYEKFKGRPPSIAFQNAATIFGLALIATLVVVTLYNDIARLVVG